MTTGQPPLRDTRRELITFQVGDQDFCMDIMPVLEIRGWTGATPLPHAPAEVLGVMNLRGAVIPILDLSARLGLGSCPRRSRNVIIITAVGTQTLGLLVTAVSDILGVGPEDVQPLPDLGGAGPGDVVEGIIASEGRTLRLLRIAALGAGTAAGQAVA